MKKGIPARNVQTVCNIKTKPWPQVPGPGSSLLDFRS